MAAITRTAVVQWTGDIAKGSGALTTQSTALAAAPLNFPKRTGEPDGETSPEELIAAAHAGCYAMSLAATIGKAGFTATLLEISAEVGLERIKSKWHITGSRLSVTADINGVDDDAFNELLKAADASCPVSSMLRATAEVSIGRKR
ncbi:OsmC family peroxiredoxin [Nonomuraea sp. NPDC059023]|uniref:OsmC family peroxiredoxin n=1 Tax=unclassified Nonomuraea TaxID=2593643 RepID=UPI0036A024E9